MASSTSEAVPVAADATPARGRNWRNVRAPIVFFCVFAWFNSIVDSHAARMRAEQVRDRMADASLDDPNEVPRRDRSCGESVEEYWKYIPDARSHRLALLVGMSQQHSIYERKQGQRLTSELMDDELAPQGVRVFGLAAPNLNNEEALLYMLATGADPRTRPHAFIYGVCFDKMRNIDLRPRLQTFLQGRPELLEIWRETATRYATRYPTATSKMLQTLEQISQPQVAASAEDTVERRLRNRLASVLPVVEHREALNGWIQQKLYELRNLVLNIKTSSKRPIMAARYDLNREFLGILAEEAKAKQIDLLPYVIPLNPLSETPYVPSEYAAFKSWFAELGREHNLFWKNLESLVPSEEWGVMFGEPDFKHFRYAGHVRTARELSAVFRERLVPKAASAK
jgi:hypothetical protein